tara:strand:+ start:94 stop:1014 length:921 start_codon:yes stop_codon:yes gene_type:complete
MKKILGINTSHNCSFAYFEDGILKEYYEEDRFNKIKNFTPPIDRFNTDPYQYEVLKKFKDIIFDGVVLASYDREEILLEKNIIDNIFKQVKFKKFLFLNHVHHILHASCGYYFSKFKEATAVVTDGGGERYFSNFQTMESIFSINKNKIKCHYKHASNVRLDHFNNFVDAEKTDKKDGVDIKVSNKSIGGYKYITFREKAGFKENEEGQMMGIAAYKDKDTDLDKNVLEIAHKAQEETLQERIELIEKALTYSDCKNIILSGGYHLNCSNNFKLVKHFPKLNFFIDPIPYDGGIAVGAAVYYENYL